MDSFLKLAFKELFADDGLLVMGRGLGINHLFSKFALYHSSLLEERKLVFCLNCSGIEDQLHNLFLSSSDSSTKNLPQVGFELSVLLSRCVCNKLTSIFNFI